MTTSPDGPEISVADVLRQCEFIGDDHGHFRCTMCMGDQVHRPTCPLPRAIERAETMQARIAQLEHKVAVRLKERESWVSLARENAKAADAAQARIAELEEALKPFAEEAKHFHPANGGYGDEFRADVSIDSLHRARAVLDQKGDADGK